MVQGQIAKRDETRGRVLAALRTIEAEIAERGTYPHNDGKVNQVEVLRRAGVGSSTLRNPHHHETRDIVEDWLAQLKQRGAPTSKLAARAAKQDKIHWYEEQLKLLSAEALKWRLQMEALEKENQELRERITTFTAERGKVIGIHGRSGDRD
jgi:predicted RNA-binding protein YlqC (UPF0109 family)